MVTFSPAQGWQCIACNICTSRSKFDGQAICLCFCIMPAPHPTRPLSRCPSRYLCQGSRVNKDPISLLQWGLPIDCQQVSGSCPECLVLLCAASKLIPIDFGSDLEPLHHILPLEIPVCCWRLWSFVTGGVLCNRVVHPQYVSFFLYVYFCSRYFFRISPGHSLPAHPFSDSSVIAVYSFLILSSIFPACSSFRQNRVSPRLHTLDNILAKVATDKEYITSSTGLLQLCSADNSRNRPLLNAVHFTSMATVDHMYCPRYARF